MGRDFDPFVAEWASYVNNPNLGAIEKYLKMAQLLEYPSLDISSYIEKINAYGKLQTGSVDSTGNFLDLSDTVQMRQTITIHEIIFSTRLLIEKLASPSHSQSYTLKWQDMQVLTSGWLIFLDIF